MEERSAVKMEMETGVIATTAEGWQPPETGRGTQ